MPILDGYKATHTIRHTAPFAGDKQIQNTPIVAMTASAIQGDREKCESAGMNDYLAKPVKGKVLERMLVKWANTRRKSLLSLQAGITPQLQQTLLSQSVGAIPRPPSAGAPSDLPSPPLVEETQANPDKLESKLNQLDFVSNSALARSSETPESRAMRHLHNEEKAMKLRDEQLISSGNDPKDKFNRGAGDENVGTKKSEQKLTRENIQKLTDDKQDHRPDEETSSMAVAVDDPRQFQGPSRPPLGERVRSESEDTVVLAEQ